MRLAALTSETASTLQELAYGYDDAGNVLEITDTVNSGQAQTFTYDDLNRLLTAETDATGTGQYDHTYVYKAIGNLTDYDGVSYTYSANQPHAATGQGNDSYSYDANGNMTGRTVGGSSYTLSYDRGNRLIGVSGPSTSAIFLYDADGNRVLATVNGATTVYIAGLFEYTGGAATSYYGGAVMRRSSYGSGNGVFYVLGDHLGSTSAIVDTSGSVQAQQYYYPYGANRGGAQSDLTDKRYTGQYHESGLAGVEGLYYYNARWYDPALARFMQADTIVPEPGNPQSLNRYAYGLNNPVKYNDPTGHAVPVDVGGHLRVHPGTGSIFAWSIAGSGLRQVIAFAQVGGDSASGRLNEILRSTASTGQKPFSLSPRVDTLVGLASRTHFTGSGGVMGDAGFAPEFQDDHLYAEQWGFETPYSKQTGHFLTAVDMGRTGRWTYPIVGHELFADTLPSVAFQIFPGPTQYDVLAFKIAVMADGWGAIEAREANLAFILNPEVHGAVQTRQGNSMEDLRLSVRGWRLGNMVTTGQIGSNKDLANWIALNVAGD